MSPASKESINNLEKLVDNDYDYSSTREGIYRQGVIDDLRKFIEETKRYIVER